MIALIAAQDRTGVIGAGGQIPWHLPADMKRFKRLTTGAVVIMGRRTWDSLPPRFRPLPDRRNIVVSRSWNSADPEVWAARSLEQALELAHNDLSSCETDRIFVIGGAQIYRQALPLADQVYLTVVDAEFVGDAHFPVLEEADWELLPSQDFAADADNPYPYRFDIYHRRWQ